MSGWGTRISRPGMYVRSVERHVGGEGASSRSLVVSRAQNPLRNECTTAGHVSFTRVPVAWYLCVLLVVFNQARFKNRMPWHLCVTLVV